MLVPKSFSFTSTSTRKERESQEKAKDTREHASSPSSRSFGWRPSSFGGPTQTVQESRGTVKTMRSPQQSSSKTSGNQSFVSPIRADRSTVQQEENRPRSQPVAVPGKRRPRDGNVLRDTSPNISMKDRRSSVKHDPNAMPPSVAALLAMTSIPRKTSFLSQGKSKPQTLARKYSSQSLMEEWKQSDLAGADSLGSSPNMHILLSPPEHAPSMSRSSSEETLDTFDTGGSSSVESLPSLSTDERSVTSSVLRSPRELPRRATREKAFSLSESVENNLEHPLSFEDDSQVPGNDDTEVEPSESSLSIPKSPNARRQSSFKSNLTASLTAIKSSWRSLSNFASTPYTLPEDHLSRALFAESQSIQREMRPRPLDRPPSAEMRRYLNPSKYHASPHMEFHHHGSVMEHIDYEHIPSACDTSDSRQEGSIIALQDRNMIDPSPQVPSGSSSNAILTEAGRVMHDSNQQHRREIRENSEWLRICLLETNMRRAGKIDGPGHAKLWLPAREVTQLGTRLEDLQLGSRKVPARWVPMNYD